MASKMIQHEDSIVGYNKRVANYTVDYNSEYDSEDDFYDNYEPYEDDEVDIYDNNEYQPFIYEEEEEKISHRIVKPFIWMNSPTKSADQSPTKKSPSWWDKNKVVEDSKRIVNGVLNYAALLPPPTKKVETPKKAKGPKKSRSKKESKPQKKEVRVIKQEEEPFPGGERPPKPTRFCLSILKSSKCFHGTKCRYAHDYDELRECNFGLKCKKISIAKTNANGTFELINKSGACCNFKHAKESKASYLKRVPQQHTSPRK